MGLFSLTFGFVTGFYVRNTSYGFQIARSCFALLKKFQNKNVDSYKLMLVVRDDLKMGQGKIAAQCSHASVLAYKNACLYEPAAVKLWESFGHQAKIVVRVSSEQELLRIEESAKTAGILTSLVCDSGYTQVIPGSKTVLAVGPGAETAINKITGHLKLMK